MLVIGFLWNFIQLYFAIHLVFPLVLLLLARLRPAIKVSITEDTALPDYGIIITAYQQIDQLPDVVASILKANYNQYMVYVVADNCDDISSLDFASDRVVLLKPETILGANVRSHFYAIDRFVRPHSHILIVDSDNLVAPDFLTEINHYINSGYKAVQGVRAAKNLDTVLARLDAARDIYYHFYDGQELFRAGSSATLAGSGMVFSLDLYKSCLAGKDVTGAGFDKVLQHAIVENNQRIAFAENAIVWDEKTSSSEQLVKQRARWINTWFRYFSKGFGLIANGVFSFDLNKLLFGIVLIRPPLFILLLFAVFSLLLNLWIQPVVALIWFIGILLFVMGFMLSLKMSKTDSKIYKALFSIPTFMFYQIKSMFILRKANTVSVATKHGIKKNNVSNEDISRI